MRRELDTYFREISKTQLLSAEQEIELGRAIKGGDQIARNRMIAANLRLVANIAKKYIRTGVPLDDLIQEGNFGLFRAVDDFDSEYGTRFSTYATYHIKGAIRRAVARNRSRESQLVNDDDSGDGSLEQFVSDPSASAEASLLQKEETQILLKRMKVLDKRSALIIRLRFGLKGKAPQTLEKIGEQLGLTKQRVKQLEELALDKLRGEVDSIESASSPKKVVELPAPQSTAPPPTERPTPLRQVVHKTRLNREPEPAIETVPAVEDIPARMITIQARLAALWQQRDAKIQSAAELCDQTIDAAQAEYSTKSHDLWKQKEADSAAADEQLRKFTGDPNPRPWWPWANPSAVVPEYLSALLPKALPRWAPEPWQWWERIWWAHS